MHLRHLLPIIILCLFACKSKEEKKQEKFDKTRWATMNGESYPYRDQMLHDLVYNVPLKGLKKEEMLDLLGQPTRMDNGHYFYLVAQDFIGNTLFPLHTKTLVIKLDKDSTVEWRKIAE